MPRPPNSRLKPSVFYASLIAPLMSPLIFAGVLELWCARQLKISTPVLRSLPSGEMPQWVGSTEDEEASRTPEAPGQRRAGLVIRCLRT